MASVNEAILDTMVAHQVGLHRYSTATVRKIIALLNRVDARIVAEIAALSGEEDSLSRARLEKLIEAVRLIVKEACNEVSGQFDADVKRLSAYEAGYQHELFKRMVPVRLDIIVPSAAHLYAAVHARPFAGRLLKEWYSGLEAGAQERLRNTIRMGFVEGRTTAQIIREVRGTKAQNYADGVLEISRRSAETMVRTALAHTANVSRGEVYKQNAGVIKGVKWVSTLDNRTSAVCRARDGTVYPVDSGPRPPAHPNCLPGDSLVLAGGGITGASKRWFEGELVSIRTGDGRELRATPNHPVLTDRGWIGIGFLNRGDKLICLRNPERASAAVDTGNNDVEASIHDKTESFFRSRNVATVPVPTTTPNFHGDGAGSEVAIIGTNGGLAVESEFGFFKEGSNLSLQSGLRSLALLLSFGAFAEVRNRAFHAPDGIMCFNCEGGDFIGGGAIHPSLLLLTAIAEFDSIFTENALNRAWADAEFICDPANADSFGVTIDDVVSVERCDFKGHVYNLETEKHVYFSQGIVTHNCRSTTIPVLKSWKEMGIDLKEAPEGTRASMDGQVPADMTYQRWLEGRSKEEQDDILGVAKGRLFRQGGLTLDRFVDRAGKEFTLDELKRREAEAWARAGLD